MPLPTPRKDEKRADFMRRCMGNPTANKEFPNKQQRFAVCTTQARKKPKS